MADFSKAGAVLMAATPFLLAEDGAWSNRCCSVAPTRVPRGPSQAWAQPSGEHLRR